MGKKKYVVTFSYPAYETAYVWAEDEETARRVARKEISVPYDSRYDVEFCGAEVVDEEIEGGWDDPVEEAEFIINRRARNQEVVDG